MARVSGRYSGRVSLDLMPGLNKSTLQYIECVLNKGALCGNNKINNLAN